MQNSNLKLVIPAAGSGTRLGKLTTDIAKPLIDAGNGMSTIANIVVDALNAKINDIIVICRPQDKEQIRRDVCPTKEEFEEWLNSKRGVHLKDYIRIQDEAKITLLEQLPEHGQGDLAALIAATPYLKGSDFIVAFGDGLFPENVIKQISEVFVKHSNAPLVALATVDKKKVSSFGVAKYTVNNDILNIDGFVEKPPVEDAPSTEVAVGVYALPAKTVDIFSNIPAGADGEKRLADVFAYRIQNNEQVNGFKIHGAWLDTGNHAVLASTRLQVGLRDPKIAPELEAVLKELGYVRK